MKSVDISVQDLNIVLAILRKNLSPGTHVWVFGSRAQQHTAKRFSDLDLAIDAGSSLPYEVLVSLSHDFDESALPFKIDIVDWHAIDSSFQERIAVCNTPSTSWDCL
ncbi:MAG: nucleotidyltransferase domain-containing protein [Legionellaceae bacterium]|nr:nucleotidyltransferase domain-containing protein [Legionellaceae bacterium]MBP9774733.1 nucleotidyltransferase domain-containing protein [Legionellaceae bacterium]